MIEIEVCVMSGSQGEYQYHLKDHLGNVRLTFTTKEEVESVTATLEDAKATTEQSQFLNYAEVRKIDNKVFDHTNEGGTYNSTRLMGGNTTEVYGLAKTLSVMPGDVIRMEVYAKYLDPETANWSAALQNIISSIAGWGNAGGTYVDGGQLGTTDGAFPHPGLLVRENDEGEGPKAYLNYLVFDRDFNYLTGGFERVSTAARESGTTLNTNAEGVNHERLHFDDGIVINEAGYVYIYLSNENETPVEVFFDDFMVEQVKSPVVQMDDYYPFGLTFNSYARENTTPQDFRYNGKELQDELNLGWLDYGARMYMPDLGRWGAIDPSVELYYDWTPFNYCANNPILLIDLNGKEWFYHRAEGEDEPSWQWHDGDKYNTGVKDADGNDVILDGVDAVVIYRSDGEQLGDNSNLYGEGAKLAEVWVLGPDGANDIQRYEGFSISSDGQRFGVVAEGIHDGNYDATGKSGSLESNWAVEERGRVPDEDGFNPAHPERGATDGYLTGVFVHSSNRNGFAGLYQKKYPKGHAMAGQKRFDSSGNPVYGGISEGCLLIAPGRDGNGEDWERFKAQMNGAADFALDITRSLPRKPRLSR